MKAEDFYKVYVPYPTKRINPKDAITLMEMFAKEEMEQFWIWVHKNKSMDERIRYSFQELFDQWKSKQEE
ncbi:MAG TPA: hypothetical protein ENH82_03935 [bacterium]|nr:hypothetical protein [bacterium]